MAPGIWQILLIVLVVLLIFGAGKLPNVMGDLAKGVRNFKKGLEVDDESEQKTAQDSPKVVSDVSKQNSQIADKETEKS